MREAVVLAREDAPGDKRLVAYVAGDETAGADALRAHLGERLPAYMVPAAYVRLDALPLTPNGKLDRGALPAPEGDAYAARATRRRAGETEEALAEIWAEVLGVERVGRQDDFFDLGGHSLLAVQVISRVRQVLGVEVALGELFTRPVLADFARELETAARAELPPDRAGAPRGPAAALVRAAAAVVPGALGAGRRVPHPPAPAPAGRAGPGGAGARAGRIVARHEALRTTFAQVDGDPEQRIAPADAGSTLSSTTWRAGGRGGGAAAAGGGGGARALRPGSGGR